VSSLPVHRRGRPAHTRPSPNHADLGTDRVIVLPALLSQPAICETTEAAVVNHNEAGARYQIVVDGIPRSNRDTKAAALEAAELLRKRGGKSTAGQIIQRSEDYHRHTVTVSRNVAHPFQTSRRSKVQLSAEPIGSPPYTMTGANADGTRAQRPARPRCAKTRLSKLGWLLVGTAPPPLRPTELLTRR
jgi:hypothetical protein